MNKPKGKILNKMITFTALIALAPLVIAALSVQTFSALQRQEIEVLQRDVISKIERDIDSRMALLLQVLSPQYNRPADHIAEVREETIVFDGISRPQVESLLNKIIETAPEIVLLRAIDGPSGAVVMTKSPRHPDMENSGLVQNVRQLPFYERVVGGDSYIDPEIRTTLEGPLLTIAAPIRTQEKAVPGFLIATIDIRNIVQEVITSHKTEFAGYVYITDQDGRLLLHSDSPIIAPVSMREVGLVGSLLLRTNVLRTNGPRTEGQQRYTSLWGKEVVGSGLMKIAPPIGIFVEIPAETADFVLSQLTGRLLLFTVLVLTLAILLSIFLARVIVSPIKLLEEGTQRVSRGELTAAVTIKTGDEMEELGEAFNEMTKGLKRLQELRDEFVFVAAHELRTPVTAINGYISLVLENLDDVKKNARFLEQVKISSKRLLQLVEDLLEVARSEAGRLEIKVTPVSIVEPIKDVLAELKPLADQKQIALAYEPVPLPQVMGDAGRIKEVMVNIVGNAIKYTIGSGTVTITHEVTGDQLITHIKDTGLGMSKEALQKLFTKFYRVQTEQTQNITGTGLGLFIVKEIVEKMGGKVWVESEEGKGRVFHLGLKLE